MAPRPPSFPAPVTYVTQARPDGSYVANVLVSVAAAGVAAVVKEELRAARGRPQRLAPQGSR
jgi:hypothetical protein